MKLGIQELLKPDDMLAFSVQHLAEVQFHEHKSKIYLPDVLGRLLPDSELVYDDAPWLFGLEGVDNSFGSASTMVFNAKRTS